MATSERLYKLTQADPLAREELVSLWLRKKSEPSAESHWLLVMEESPRSLREGNKTRAVNLVNLSLESPNRRVRQWAYAVPQAFSDFRLSIEVLLSIWSQEEVERLLRRLKQPQSIRDYTDKVERVFIDSGVVVIEDGFLSVGPNAPIPPMPAWELQE